MKRALQFIILFISIIIISCSEKNTDVNIIAPENGETFNTGDMIEVKAKIYDPDIIRGESIIVTSANGDTIFNYSDTESHFDQSHTLIKSFEAISQGNCNITVSAFGEGSGSKSVIVNVN